MALTVGVLWLYQGQLLSRLQKPPVATRLSRLGVSRPWSGAVPWEVLNALRLGTGGSGHEASVGQFLGASVDRGTLFFFASSTSLTGEDPELTVILLRAPSDVDRDQGGSTVCVILFAFCRNRGTTLWTQSRARCLIFSTCTGKAVLTGLFVSSCSLETHPV